MVYKLFLMKREYPKHPIAAVGVVVLKKGKVLLIKRNKPPKSFEWSIPGGAQDLGEKLKETAKREVWEEAGIRIKNLTLVDAVDFIKKNESNTTQNHYSLIDYMADYDGGDLTAGDDAIDAKWVAVDELQQYNLWQETTTLIQKAIALKTKD